MQNPPMHQVGGAHPSMSMYPNGMVPAQDHTMQMNGQSQMQFVNHPNAFPGMEHQQAQQQQPMQVATNQPPPGTIPLSMLLEFAVHKTYTDITVKQNLLPGKSDLDKKIELVKFATQTRQLFVRILGLVKWAGQVGKVVKCSEIIDFLDNQSMKFIDTADRLHHMANLLVVQARLPNFSVPAAVDVLTTGTYPRLPTCIRDKIIPPEPISLREKRATIKRIEQMVMYRLAIEKIPPQIYDLKVKSGVVHLHVPGEFDAALTLMGDTDDIPWRLLRLKFLVEDFDVGSGRTLVHERQVDHIHQLAQSRLFANVHPIADLYNMLHSFCLSLQLEVLCSQADRLIKLRWGKFISIDEYLPGQKLTLSYWKHSPYKSERTPMSVVIKVSPVEESKPLQAVHKPALPLMDLHLVKNANHIKHLSVERLIHNSVAVRSFHLLSEMKTMLQKYVKAESSHFAKFETSQSCVLVVPLLEGKNDTEDLRIHIDPQTGAYTPTMPGISRTLLDKMESEINKNETSFLTWWKILQKEAIQVRCKRTLQHLPVKFVNKVNLVNQQGDFLDTIKNKCLYVRMINYPSYYLVLELVPDADSPIIIKFKYHLLRTARSSSATGGEGGKSSSDGRFNYMGGLTGVSLLELKPSLHAPHEKPVDFIKNLSSSDPTMMDFDEGGESSAATTNKKDSKRGSVDLLSEMRSIVILTNYRLPFGYLLECLRENGFEKCGLREENNAIECWIDSMPHVDKIGREANALLRSHFRKCTFRQGEHRSKQWSVEVIFDKPDFGIELFEQRTRDFVVCHFTYECHTLREEGDITALPPRPDCVKQFAVDWSSVAHLFVPVYMLARQLKLNTVEKMRKCVRVYSYDYKTITIKYGAELNYTVTVFWQHEKGFQLTFGRCGGLSTAGINPHHTTKLYMTEAFNDKKDLLKLMYLLNDTLPVLLALSRLPDASVMGVHSKSVQPENVFSVVPITTTRYRVNFYSVYCLDIYCRMDGYVQVRDASFSQFDHSKTRGQTVPIPGLGKFLMFFSDRHDVLHRPEQLNDNPPSPQPTPQPQQYDLHDLPNQAYAGNVFALLSHTVLNHICQPMTSNHQIRKSSLLYKPSILEQFLSAALTHRNFVKNLKSMMGVQGSDVVDIPLTMFNDQNEHAMFGTAFTTHQVAQPQFVCYMDVRNLRMSVPFLALKVFPPRNDPMNSWTADEFNILERYFAMRIFVSPYRFNAMKAYLAMLAAPPHFLKDFIKLMRLELNARGPPVPRWYMSLSLTVHPRASYAPAGMASIIVKEDKILVFIQLTLNHQVQGGQALSIDIPMLLQPSNNQMDLLQPALSSSNNPQLNYLQQISRLLGQIRNMTGTLQNDAAFSTCTRYLMDNLQILPP